MKSFMISHSFLYTCVYLLSLVPSVSPFQTAPTTIDISESAPRDVVSLYDWAANYGIQRSDCFELSSEDGLDIYAITNQNIPADSPIICVPNNLIMSGTKSFQELTAEDPTIQKAEEILSPSDSLPLFYLFLNILRQFELGDQSPWYQWLNSLPRYYSNGASMTDFCFGCLPPYAAQQALAEKTRLKRFELALNEISSATIQLETKSNKDLCKWAYNVVHTRHQELEGGDCCLIPLADYFNHGGTESDVYFSYDDEGNCYVYSTHDTVAGQPLRMCYSDPSNPSSILAKWGFLDSSSPATFCKYLIDEPSPELYQLGYPSQMVFYDNGSVSKEVWDIILYEHLEVSGKKAFYRARMSGDEATIGELHEKYFAQTFNVLQTHVKSILNDLDELETGLDTQMSMGKDAKRHPRLQLLRSHNEFVKNTFELVEQNLNQMFS